jgi:hypothetical protein
VLRERAEQARALALAAGVYTGTLDFGGEALVLGMEHLEALGEEDPECAAAELAEFLSEVFGQT